MQAKLTAAAAAAGPFFMAASRLPRLCTRPRCGGDPIALGAVNAAKKYSGEDDHVISEAQPQALDPKNFSGPLWEQLTGVKLNVVEARSRRDSRSQSPSTSPSPVRST